MQIGYSSAQQYYLAHTSAAEHYERLKTANASNSQRYYQYAERQYFHRWRAIFYRQYFKAPVDD
ncbi:hypothetical protein [Alteribacter populi]|uniref:hypothetical protein n=1 Tax=Alteribacter populi TaxID=2011011 RepID=UPI0012FF882E|nr:hypothetical protein [Alteribacter populi]